MEGVNEVTSDTSFLKQEAEETIKDEDTPVYICHDTDKENHTASNALQPLEINSSLKPLTIFLYLFGLTFVWDKNRKLLTALTVTYHFLLHISVGATVLFFCRVYSYGMAFGPMLSLKINIHTAFICIWISVASQTNATRLWKNVERSWIQYHQDFRSNNDVEFRLMKRLSVVLGIVSFLVCVGFMIHFLNERLLKEKSILEKLYEPFTLFPENTTAGAVANVFYKIFSCVYLNLGYTLPFNYLLVICSGLWQELRRFNQDFKEACSKLPDSIDLTLEHFRRRHIRLCQLVKKVDEIYSFFILFWVLVCVIGVCLVLYTLVQGSVYLDQEIYGKLVLFLLPALVLPILGLLLLCLAGTKVYDQMSAAKNTIYSIEIEKKHWENTAGSLSYHSFLSHLIEGNYGLSGWGFFYVNKLTVKTIVVLIISYSTILIKFGSNEDGSKITGFFTGGSLIDGQTNVTNQTNANP